MIEDVKKILNTIIENSNIDFEVYSDALTNKDFKYTISYKIGKNRFSIRPSLYSKDKIFICKNGILIKTIKCLSEEYLEIELLINKLARIYKDRSYNEFIHSLDENIRNN